MRVVHPTARVDVGAGFIRYFVTDYFTPSWRRVPMFGRNSNNGSVEWLGVPDFMRTNAPLGLPISWLPILVGETKGPATILTVVVDLGGFQTVFLSRGIVPSVYFQFTTV